MARGARFGILPAKRYWKKRANEGMKILSCENQRLCFRFRPALTGIGTICQ
jgi:hypothetical protein